MPTKPESTTGCTPAPVVEIDQLAVHYQLQGSALSRLLGRNDRTVKAIDGVDLRLAKGEVLGLVGESGSGKTTLGRALLGLAPATEGSIHYHPVTGGVLDVASLKGAQLRKLRTEIQMVFQDPNAALNPSMTIEQAVGDPLVIHKIAKGDELRRRVSAALDRVGLYPPERYLSKFPSDLSGGQKQRAVIARAIILDPEVLVADEPVSMLDMSVRAKILQLMLDLKQDLGLTYVYITHDLATAKYFCDRIAIMYLGRIVEIGPTEEIFANPRHPYTKALLAAIPEPDPERSVPRDLPRGEIPDAASPPLGCAFHPRCPEALAECGWESRDLRALIEQHWTRSTPEVFESESRQVGSLDSLNAASSTASFGANAESTQALLERIRAEDPNEPLWRGVRSQSIVGGHLQVEFATPVEPRLRAAGDVEVACHLYPEGASRESDSG